MNFQGKLKEVVVVHYDFNLNKTLKKSQKLGRIGRLADLLRLFQIFGTRLLNYRTNAGHQNDELNVRNKRYCFFVR
jgi:hypothetical protein